MNNDLEKNITDMLLIQAEVSNKSIHTVFRNGLKSQNYDHIDMVMEGKRSLQGKNLGIMKKKAYEVLSTNKQWLESKIKQSEEKTEWLKGLLDKL